MVAPTVVACTAVVFRHRTEERCQVLVVVEEVEQEERCRVGLGLVVERLAAVVMVASADIKGRHATALV